LMTLPKNALGISWPNWTCNQNLGSQCQEQPLALILQSADYRYTLQR